MLLRNSLRLAPLRHFAPTPHRRVLRVEAMGFVMRVSIAQPERLLALHGPGRPVWGPVRLAV